MASVKRRKVDATLPSGLLKQKKEAVESPEQESDPETLEVNETSGPAGGPDGEASKSFKDLV